MWSNEIQCNYVFMFLLKRLARKELIVTAGPVSGSSRMLVFTTNPPCPLQAVANSCPTVS